MYFPALCLIGVKFADLNHRSFIQLAASSPLTRGQGSHSHPIIEVALINRQPASHQNEFAGRGTRPIYSADFSILRRPECHTVLLHFEEFQTSPADD